MSRLSNTIMPDVSFNKDTGLFVPQVDLAVSGQFGYQPDGAKYVNNAGYRPQRIIPILIEAPRGFQFAPNPDKSIAVLKQLMETQSKNITGLRSGLNVEWAERAIDGSGRMQRDPTNITEEISNPNHTWDERYGRPVHNFWKWYIRTFIGDPVTNQPGIMNLPGDLKPTDHLPDLYTFTMLYIQPDPLRTKVEEAWLQIGMSPNTSGVLESQFDVTAGSDVPEIAIEFGGVPYSTLGVLNFAQSILDGINYVGAGPLQRPNFLDGIEANIGSAEGGFQEDITAAASNGIIGG